MNGTQKRGGAIDTSCRTFEHFDARQFVLSYGKIECIVGGMWISNGYTIEKERRLLTISTPDTDVSLCT